MFISIKTVGNHVGNILNKTDSANRTGAASFANQHGLVTPDPVEGSGYPAADTLSILLTPCAIDYAHTSF